MSALLRLDIRQGACAQRTEPYLTYGKGAAQQATQYDAKISNKQAGFARPVLMRRS